MNFPLASRRSFLQTVSSGIGVAGSSTLHAFNGQRHTENRRPRVAALFTVLRFRSHAFNILENFLGPYYFNGQLTDPGVDIVAMYADQFPDDDMAREVSRRFKIPLYGTIPEAICAGGTQLGVDAVLSIGEHGDYPYNARGQHLYPRKRFFDEAVSVMKRDGRYVPFFNDKHLSYRWDWSREMFDVCRNNKVPLLAGSSVPLAQRRPVIQLPVDSEIEEAVSIHGGGLESYDFHALEVLQSFVESRQGGETGVREIQLLTGEAFLEAKRHGRWSQDLVDAAMKCEARLPVGRQPRPSTGVFAPSPTTPTQESRLPYGPAKPKGDYAICISYLSGLKATVLKVGSSSDRWNFACRLKSDPHIKATALFNGPWGNRCLFKALSHAIQQLFTTGMEPYPAERTLLTTGMTEAVMHSWEEQGNTIQTPHLNIRYRTADWKPFRETGASWSIITSDVPQSATFQPRPWDSLPNSHR